VAASAAALPALIASYTPGPGGSERILADHATALGDDVCVACPPGWLFDALRSAGVRVFPLRARPLELRGGGARRRVAAALQLAGHGREVRTLERNLRPRVVVAWGMRSLLGCAPAGLEAPLVFQHNDLAPGPAIGRAVAAAGRRCALAIALSETIAFDLGLPGTRVIHPGVDLERFARAAAAPEPDSPPGRGEPPPATPPRALFLAALAPWKRPELAIEAAERAGLPLVVAGEAVDAGGGEAAAAAASAYAASLRDRAGAHVTFAGRLDDPRPALAAASCLIHTADREPFGLALVEALACGVPVVAPDRGGPAEIVDESCGRLFPPGDAAAAAHALTAVVADRQRLSTGARTRAERHFDLRASRRAWAEAIDAVAPPAPAPPTGDGIAIVTVLHDSEPEVRALMASLDRHLPAAHLVAVDSGSRDGGADAVRGWRGRSTVIDLGENVGYGRGTNAGVRAVEEPIAVVANPDVELFDSSLATLARDARTGPERILAPLVVQPDGAREPSAHPEPASAGEALAAALPPMALPPKARARARPSEADDPRPVAWAAGCCLVARTETLRALGPFDERAFLYGEDMDLGLRAADAGIPTVFRPDARIVHHRAHSTEREFGGEAFDLLARRRAEVVKERRGPTRARLDTALQALTFATRIAGKAVLRRPTTRERAQLRALRRVRCPG
jgi:N-acetylglucosaminyl-diphospho-decaprenol L-rhamnosyltransferase